MGDEKVKAEALELLGMFQVLPRLVVFDLDYTLWPFYCECRSKRDMPSLYHDGRGILYALKEKGIDLAIASRSPTADIAETFLDKLSIKSMFVAKEIFSSWTHKTDHFRKIQSRTGVPFNSMLFFDDENRNIQAVSKMGVTSILVNEGVHIGALRQGLTKYSENVNISEKNKQKWRTKFSQNSNSSKKNESEDK
ncbi:magnesium-dependent phosphatase 1 [Rosa chinensis]|nr:magnesium-dependent phosphatase 1 [Rosa chinensis]